MVNPCPNGFCVNWHYNDPYDGVQGRVEPMCYSGRPVDEVRFRPDGTVFDFPTGKIEWGWESGYIERVYEGDSYTSLGECQRAYQDWASSTDDYFTIDPDTRIRCFSPSAPTPPPSLILRGTASPPPPPPRKMCGCDCNTIASIIAEHMAEKQRLLDAIREHIDSRAIEQLQHINKMLQDIDMDLDLQPVIDEVKRVEKNLWNGINGV